MPTPSSTADSRTTPPRPVAAPPVPARRPRLPRPSRTTLTVAGFWLGTRASLVVFTVLACWLLRVDHGGRLTGPTRWFLERFTWWDSFHFLRIVDRGYLPHLAGLLRPGVLPRLPDGDPARDATHRGQRGAGRVRRLGGRGHRRRDGALASRPVRHRLDPGRVGRGGAPRGGALRVLPPRRLQRGVVPRLRARRLGRRAHPAVVAGGRAHGPRDPGAHQRAVPRRGAAGALPQPDPRPSPGPAAAAGRRRPRPPAARGGRLLRLPAQLGPAPGTPGSEPRRSAGIGGWRRPGPASATRGTASGRPRRPTSSSRGGRT